MQVAKDPREPGGLAGAGLGSLEAHHRGTAPRHGLGYGEADDAGAHHRHVAARPAHAARLPARRRAGAATIET